MLRRARLSLPFALLTVGALSLLACNADDDKRQGGDPDQGPRVEDLGPGADGSTGPCSTRRDCLNGTVCDQSLEPPSCVDPPANCEGNEDCAAGSICVIDRCVPGCNNSSDCLNGWNCREVTAGVTRCQKSCTERADCPADHQCSEGACVPEVQLCASCLIDEDCGGAADRCLMDEGAGYCAKDCSLRGTCEAGFRCEDVDGAKQCVPATGTCLTVCPLNPCADGQVCNVVSGGCQDELGPCDRCTETAQCVEEARCITYGQQKLCLLTCPDGQDDCPTGYLCDASGGTPYCVPRTGTCDRCAGKYCGPLTPYCNPEDGSCVECLGSRHCGLGETCARSLSCVPEGPACGGEEEACGEQIPFCYEERCVECLSSGDCSGGADLVCHHFRCMGEDFCQRVACPAGTRCDNEARRCIETGTCETDADCPGRRCDDVRGVCFNADGSCVSSGECPPRLECDPELRICVGCGAASDCRPLQACFPLQDGRRYCHQL